MGRLLQILGLNEVKKNSRARSARTFRPTFELCEDRQMLSAMPISPQQPMLGTEMTPAFVSSATPGDTSGNGITARFSPADIRGAYGFTSAMTGAGQTVAIVVAFNVFDEAAAGARITRCRPISTPSRRSSA